MDFVKVILQKEVSDTHQLIEYWLPRGKLIEFKPGWIDSGAASYGGPTGKLTFYEGTIEIYFEQIGCSLLMQDEEIMKNYDIFKPGDVIYTLVKSISRIKPTDTREKIIRSVHPAFGILKEVLPNGKMLVDTGLPIYAWGAVDGYQPQVGDWVEVPAGANRTGIMLREDALPAIISTAYEASNS